MAAGVEGQFLEDRSTEVEDSWSAGVPLVHGAPIGACGTEVSVEDRSPPHASIVARLVVPCAPWFMSCRAGHPRSPWVGMHRRGCVPGAVVRLSVGGPGCSAGRNRSPAPPLPR